MEKRAPSVDEVAGFLGDLHDEPVTDITALHGGYWSSAFAYVAGGRELVLRLGSVPEGFEMDRAAMAFGGPDLPVPEVLDIGEGLGMAYAISVRHHGRFLEAVSPDEADAAGAALSRLLAAMRAVPAPLNAAVSWYPLDESDDLSWREWITAGLVDDPQRLVHGWRAKLAANRDLDGLFRAAEARVRELVTRCPERRDLIHGDLLHSNVLLAEDASRVTGVFSWKCSARGDFLFDVAWCTFWSPWHSGIADADMWRRTLEDTSLTKDDLADAALRHHCYELQIGTGHLGWHVWTGDEDGLAAVAAHTQAVLDRGPLPT